MNDLLSGFGDFVKFMLILTGISIAVFVIVAIIHEAKKK
jgi:hypothetical protein